MIWPFVVALLAGYVWANERREECTSGWLVFAFVGQRRFYDEGTKKDGQ